MKIWEHVFHNHLIDYLYDAVGAFSMEEMADDILNMVNDDMSCSKYRWHDLRKNPEDLPDENETVITCVKYSIDDVYTYTSRVFDGDQFMQDEYECPYTVVAWRYIEPFEEVE